MYTVYLHKNKINGKCYVGQTGRKVEERWDYGCGYKASRGSLMGKAIEKYGWDSFEHIILEENLTEEEVDERERYYIQKYNTLAPNGYNLETGGNKNKHPTEATLQKMKARPHRPASDKLKEKSRIRMETNWKDEQYREKMVSQLRANNIRNAELFKKKVMCVETGIIYDSATEASSAMGLASNAVSNAIRENRRCAKYHWLYLEGGVE